MIRIHELMPDTVNERGDLDRAPEPAGWASWIALDRTASLVTAGALIVGLWRIGTALLLIADRIHR